MAETQAGYAGDRLVSEAWEALASDMPALLVDVRTAAEWNFVGLPDLSPIGKQVLRIEWQSYPTMAVNGRFVDDLEAVVAGLGFDRDVAIYFLCRSGARSRSAAIVATAAGFTAAYNVTDGFEGPLSPDGHRGEAGGWKAGGFPWRQG